MANEVFANGREISCRSGDGKSIACFPDVCLTPPDKTPATPLGVPIPYPNFGYSTDTTEGSKTVTISGKEVMLRNKSYFKKSTGDEAAKPTQKKGLLTSVVQGKVYFTSWSGDVKIEKQNAVRHLDMTTHNHACVNPNALTTAHQDSMKPPKPCPDYHKDEATACSTATPITRTTKSGEQAPNGLQCDEECKKAKTCVLVAKQNDKKACCSPATTGDHLVEAHMTKGMPDFAKIPNLYGGAPCMCVSGGRFDGNHGIAHGTRGVLEDRLKEAGKKLTYSEAKKMALMSFRHANPKHGCDEKCIEAQLDAFYGAEEKECKKPTRRQSLTQDQRDAAEARISAETATPPAPPTFG